MYEFFALTILPKIRKHSFDERWLSPGSQQSRVYRSSSSDKVQTETVRACTASRRGSLAQNINEDESDVDEHEDDIDSLNIDEEYEKLSVMKNR